MANKFTLAVTAITILVLNGATPMRAQIPTGYYDTLKGKKGAALKEAVHETIKEANVLDYGSGSGKTWDGFYSTDRTSDNKVIDRYSNDTRYFSSKGAVVSGMNIEHSFPKSWWGGSKNQAYQDLYNLMPCESKINSSKSNYPMGKVTTVKTTNGCTNIGTGSNGYMLWEPAHKWKGDFARGYMYMATAYQDLTWQGTQALQILSNNDYPTLQQWAYKLYLEWAKADAVDETEVKRNEAVSKIQGNRNPFVDFPNLMEYIWGDSTEYAFDPETTMKSSDYTGGNGSGGTVVPTTEDTIYTATFTDETGNFTTDDTSVWTRDNKYGWKGTAYKNGKRTAADASLYSPMIDLTDCTEATLQFSHAVNFASSPANVLSVEVLCDGQTTTLNDYVAWPTGTNWYFKDAGKINLNSFAGKQVQIVFHYTSTTSEASTWEIKTMTVTAKKQATSITVHTVPYSTPNTATYTIDGRKARNGRHGIVIIKENGKTRKVVK